ncbi:MAG: hypothetical protein PHH21_03120 [Candidatus Pacebacteria bacterium]|nr:hypothetical protein [Candidatus Paceibacterota bacterium]
MSRKTLTIIIAALAIVLAIFLYYKNSRTEVGDPLNATYVIDGEKIDLKDGKSETQIVPGSASKEITSVLWTPTKGDLDSDGKDDYVMILTRNSGGSGTFYYVVAGLSSNKGIIGTNEIFLGDRIAPENISITDGMILINYAERKPDDPFTIQPSVGVSKYLIIKDGQLIEK